MAEMNAYRGTKVPAYQSIGEITGLLGRFGATKFVILDQPEDIRRQQPGVIGVSFEMMRNGVPIAYQLTRRYQHKDGTRGGNAGTTKEQKARALFYHIKALLDEVDGEDVTVEEVLFPALLVRNGDTVATVYEMSKPMLERLQPGDMPRLLALEGPG